MSDLNDDLLNYELGEELDDPTLLPGPDEDELLLSDEEIEKDVTFEQKAILKSEAEKWVASKLSTEVLNNDEDLKKNDDIVSTSSLCNVVIAEQSSQCKSNDLQIDSNVSTSGELSHANISHVENEKPVNTSEREMQSKNDEVSSTNKEIEEPLVSQTQTYVKYEDNLIKKDLIQSSQESSSATEIDEMFSDPTEDIEERSKRTNIKHTNERSAHSDSPEKCASGKYSSSKRGRGGSIIRAGHFSNLRGPTRFPNIKYSQYMPQPNENLNPQVRYPYHPVNSIQTFSIPNQTPPLRIEPRPLVGHAYRLQNPNDLMFRGSRNEYVHQINRTAYYTGVGQVRQVFCQDSNISLNPSGHIRQRIPLPPRVVVSQNQSQPYLAPPSNSSQHHPAPGPCHPDNVAAPNSTRAPRQSINQPVIPRKVLINPNFKGGVEAATTQLMRDTQFMQAISNHVVHLQSDEELLRQQEEFIKRNRMHIERRRYDRSPDRSRSRERSFSPDRRIRKVNRGKRDDSPRTRPRRAGDRETENRFLKRRRSSSFEKKTTEKIEEEDEETRAYRQEIEKQKAMREKILRDKELRRRKAAEEKQEDKKLSDEPPQKLKPIIVTESKIISLKKKSSTESALQIPVTSKTTERQHVKEKLNPTAKVFSEANRSKTEQSLQQHIIKDPGTTTITTATMAVIKKTISVQADLNANSNDDSGNNGDENEHLDEALLLNDTPSPPLSPFSLAFIKSKGSAASKSDNVDLNSASHTVGGVCSSTNTFSSANRRVVLKSSATKFNKNMNVKHKPIFDRLEKKIAVNESVKRKIQRIVIKNSE